MNIDSTINFSDTKFIYFNIDQNRYNVTLKIDHRDSELKLVFDSGQFRELLENLLDEDYFEVDENGELKVSDI